MSARSTTTTTTTTRRRRRSEIFAAFEHRAHVNNGLFPLEDLIRK